VWEFPGGNYPPVVVSVSFPPEPSLRGRSPASLPLRERDGGWWVPAALGDEERIGEGSCWGTPGGVFRAPPALFLRRLSFCSAVTLPAPRPNPLVVDLLLECLMMGLRFICCHRRMGYRPSCLTGDKIASFCISRVTSDQVTCYLGRFAYFDAGGRGWRDQKGARPPVTRHPVTSHHVINQTPCNQTTCN
jgi:hypothetical protein